MEKQHKEIIENIKQVAQVFNEARLSDIDENSIDYISYKDIIKENDYEKLYSKLFLKRIDFTDIITSLLNLSDDFVIEHLINGNLEHFFDTYIEKHEGMACSHDKAYFIINCLVQSAKTGENLSLYATYGDANGQAYWSPKSIKDTETALKLFENWYFNSI